MMVEGSILTLCCSAGSSRGRRARARSARSCSSWRAARGVELTEARAARAVAAGRGAELRRRIESGLVADSGSPT